MKRPQTFDHPFRSTRDTRDSLDTAPIAVTEQSTEQSPTEQSPAEEPPAEEPPADAPPTDTPSDSTAATPSIEHDLRAAHRDRRRYERDEVRRFTRRSRRRRTVWLVSIGSVVIVSLGAVLTAFSPLMALRTIDVVGTHRLHAAAVKQALNNQLGKPLPLINFGQVKKELGAFALIRSYSTQTRPPGTLIVRIVERQPIGLVKTTAGYNLVDVADVTISSSTQRPGGYPVIVLPTGKAGAATKAAFAASASVLSALPPSVAPTVDSITASTPSDVSLTLLSGKTVLWGGPDSSDLKAADLGALLKSAPDASVYDVSSPTSPVTQ